MKKKPLISIIMSVRNGEKYLSLSINSIKRQTFKDYEFIIIDDGSSDNTPNILKKIKDSRIKVMTNHKKLGLTRSLNIALKNTFGKYIARMDCDDISRYDRLMRQYKFMENHPNIGVLGSNVRIIGEDGRILGVKRFPSNGREIKRLILFNNPIRHSTVIFRKNLIDKYGNYDVSLDGAEDYDLWLRLSKHTNLFNLPESLVDYRIHDESVSEKSEKKVLLSAINARVKALRIYHYPKAIILPIIYSSFFLIIPSSVKKSFYKCFKSILKIEYSLIRFLLMIIKKTDSLSAISLHLVKITNKYPEAVHHKHLINPDKKWFINYICNSDKVLDIGCNNGKNTIVAANTCASIIGIDIDSVVLHQAGNELLRAKFKNVKFKKWDIENGLPFSSESFNKVLLFAVLEHVNKRKQLIQEVYRVLKKDGLLLLSVPNSQTIWKTLLKKYNVNYFSDSDHKIEFSRKSIINFLKVNKFNVIKISQVSFDMPFVGFIDVLGGFSLTIYKLLTLARKYLVRKYPKETVSYEIIAQK